MCVTGTVSVALRTVSGSITMYFGQCVYTVALPVYVARSHKGDSGVRDLGSVCPSGKDCGSVSMWGLGSV